MGEKDLQLSGTTGKALGSLAPQTLEEAMKFCDFLATSTVVPKDFIGKPANIFVAVQWGMELGLAPLQAMQNIAVINGRPSIWGDAMLALVMASPVFGDINEFSEGSGDNEVAICQVRRKGGEWKEQRFSVADAKAAKLYNKTGPWSEYRSRMLKMRARSWALRDTFPDVLKGMPCTEEIRDIEAEYTVETTGKGKPEVKTPKAKGTQAAEPAQQTKAETAKENQAPPTGAQKVENTDTIEPGAVRLIYARLKGLEIEDKDVCAFFGIQALSEIKKTQMNEVLAAIKQGKVPKGGAQGAGDTGAKICDYCHEEMNDAGYCHTPSCPNEEPPA